MNKRLSKCPNFQINREGKKGKTVPKKGKI